MRFLTAHLLFLWIFTLGFQAKAQKKADPATFLQSGPMVGYSEMREVMLWVQTNRACQVYVEYQEKDQPASEVFLTNAVMTSSENAFTAHLLADRVLPGKTYEGTLRINGKKIGLSYPFTFHARDLWQWRTDPPAFKAIVGSCAYFNDSLFDRPGKPYGSEYEVFEAIGKDSGDLMLWLGDNIYLNEVDWNTRTGIYYRYTHGRSYKVLQPLLASMSHYAIWDDHDYGPNDADRSFVHKDLTYKAFQDFWANPGYGVHGQGGVTSMFTWSDCDFFLLDDRTFRSPNGLKSAQREMLGKAQVDWLIDALKGSQAPFKFVCVGGMVLSTADVYENYIHVAPEERKRLLDAIQLEEIKGVIFLTGDRHHTEMSLWKPAGGYPVYDLCASPFTSGTYPGDGDKNTLLIPGTEYVGHNYATLEVSGPRTDRKLVISCKDNEGNLVWSQEITAKSLQTKQ
ncbi:MAG: alkaline phosphatase family protein [Bacteroidetes bacterium]|nr:alkaline phosphatase family protein [Bacteroidota bacterium]